jgi:hypothetical protein
MRRKINMYNMNLLFDGFKTNQAKLIKKLPSLNHKIAIYYGFSNTGNYRLALKSSIKPSYSKSTKVIQYSIVENNINEYWCYFDLNDVLFLNIYYRFVESIIETILSIEDEEKAMLHTQNLFELWKRMFEKKHLEMSSERAQGLFGELYTLINVSKYTDKSINLDQIVLGWGGGENLTKDITFDDRWFEIKTRKLSTDKIKITRIEQLESNFPGYLVAVTVEIMSEAYNIKPSSINELVQVILASVQSPFIKSKFLERLDLYGYDFLQEIIDKKFCVLDLSFYEISCDFPKISKSDITKPEIIDVSYSLSINSLERFKVQKWR